MKRKKGREGFMSTYILHRPETFKAKRKTNKQISFCENASWYYFSFLSRFTHFHVLHPFEFRSFSLSSHTKQWRWLYWKITFSSSSLGRINEKKVSALKSLNYEMKVEQLQEMINSCFWILILSRLHIIFKCHRRECSHMWSEIEHTQIAFYLAYNKSITVHQNRLSHIAQKKKII